MDMAKIVESKHAYRRRLAQRPIREKLLLLDELRVREEVLRKGRKSGLSIEPTAAPPESAAG